MTTHQRVTQMLKHQPADRVPITDEPWGPTVARWRREGLPANVDWADYFELDKFASFGLDSSPGYPEKILEKTDEYVVRTTKWGVTMKDWTSHGGVPEFLDFTIKDRDSWAKAKALMTPSHDRIPWDFLKEAFPKWRREGAWIYGNFWFGFDVTHSWTVGTQRVLESFVEDPEWLVDIFNYCLDMSIALFDQVWDAGYHFDAINWWDDMGYKGHQFFSLQTYRDLLKPAHKRAVDWAHAHGIKARLHSCGNILPFIPELVEIGVDILNPIEVKAGMDPIALKGQYGKQLVFNGGLNAALFWEPEKLYQHMRQVIPVMKQNGGYILSSDHSIPDSVSLEQFREFVRLAKELGTY